MYIYYDSKGVLKEIVNDDAIRQGNSNFNKIYFFIEGADPQIVNSVYQALLFNNGLRTFIDVEGNNLTTEQFSLITVNKQISYDKKRELKFFKYFTNYQMFEITVPDEILNESGTVGCRIQMTLPESTIMTLGLLVFNVEMTALGQAIIQPDTAINIAQWNYLIANMLSKDTLNIQNGNGENALQQKRDTEYVDFTGRNPNAEALDGSLSDTFETGASGVESAALNGNTMAMAKRSMSNGNKTIAKGEESHAEGYQSVTLGDGSHAEGNQTVAYGNGSHSEGILTRAIGNESHAEGNQTTTYAQWGHAEGVKTIVKDNYLVVDSGDTPSPIPTPTPEPATPEEKDALNGIGAHTEGHSNFALGLGAHAEGVNNKGYGRFSHTEGGENQSGEIIIRKTEDGKDYYTPNQDKQYQHAEGYQTLAKGTASHAEGLGTIANQDFQHVSGKYNDNKADTLFEVGNGTDGEHRSNAFEVLADGRVAIGANPINNMDLVPKKYLEDVISALQRRAFTKVDITIYPTLASFLLSTGEEGIIYLYPIDTSDLTKGFKQYIWEDNSWLFIGDTNLDLTNYVTTNTDQTITGNKTFKGQTIYKYDDHVPFYTFYMADYDALICKRENVTQFEMGNNSIFVKTIYPLGNASYDLGMPSLAWRNLHLSGTQTFYSSDNNGENWNVVNTSGNLYFKRTGLSATFIIGGVRVTSKTIIPVDNGNQTLGQPNAKWKDLYLAGNISDGTASFTVDSAYSILYGKTSNNLPILEYENKNVITTSLGTTITLRAAKTGCLPIYEGFITNISASAISFGFPNSLTLLTNDEDNVSVSGSILTIGAGVTIEFSLCDNKLVAINWAV